MILSLVMPKNALFDNTPNIMHFFCGDAKLSRKNANCCLNVTYQAFSHITYAKLYIKFYMASIKIFLSLTVSIRHVIIMPII